MKKQERSAIELVARQFSATWEPASGSADAYITMPEKRIAIEIRPLKRHGSRQGHSTKPRLRFDKVVIRLLERLQASLGDTLTEGMTLLLTVTAPIRLPAKTSASLLEEKIKALVGRALPRRDQKHTIHGNRVQIRLLTDAAKQTPKLVGFVHNSETDPLLLLNMTCEFLELFSSEAIKPRPMLADDRWLIVVSRQGSSCLETYRYIYSQLRLATEFAKILMVFDDGRVGMLTPP